MKPKVDCQVSALTLAKVRADSINGMNRGIYSATAGMSMLQKQLDVVANNLANVSTNGYKKDILAFNDVLGSTLRSGTASIGSMGYGPNAAIEVTAFDEVGQITATGNPLDIAIEQPKGAFAIRSQADGQIYYTRDGAFTRSSEGKLVTKSGDLVLDDRLNEIDLSTGPPEVKPDGTILVNGTEAGKIGVFDGQFRKVGGNRWAGNASPIEDSKLRGAALEGSNVNSIEAMVGMIELQRAFEIAQRSITTQDELSQRLISSLLNG